MTSFSNNFFRDFRRISPEGLPKHQAVIHCLRAHNSDMVIISTTDCKLTAYHVADNSYDLLDEVDKYKGWVVKCELSMDNTFLVVLVEKMVAIYNARKRFVPITKFRPHMFVFNDISWSKCMTKVADEQLLATCSKDGTIRLWRGRDILSKRLNDLQTAQQPHITLGVFQDPTALYRSAALEDPGHLESVVCIAFDPTDRFILSGGVDYRIILWNIAKGGVFEREFDGMYVSCVLLRLCALTRIDRLSWSPLLLSSILTAIQQQNMT